MSEGIQPQRTELHEINSRFPVRKSRAQKDQFLAWAKAEAEKLGYRARVEDVGQKKQHRNLVIGNPKTAQTVFTAHYDTPAGGLVPNIMMPRNLILFLLYQILIVGGLLAVSFGVMLLASSFVTGKTMQMNIFFITYMGLLMLMLHGPANKHNVNDNTSGVAAVMALMAALPEEERKKAAFILFDNEEKGKLGSKAYAKEHPEVASMKLLVNMDCVGVGDHILVLPRRMAAMHPLYRKLEGAFSDRGAKHTSFFGAWGTVCNSDQKNFDCGVAVVACKKAPVVGYYTARIHTRFDTVADQENVDYIADNLACFVASLETEENE